MAEINISVGYDLADSILNAIKGNYDEVYLEDFLSPDEKAFWQRRRTPFKLTLLHELLTNWESMRWEDSFDGHDRESADRQIREYLSMCRLPVPEKYGRALKAFEEGSRTPLCELLKDAYKVAAASAFHLLFSDREFLGMFGHLIVRSATSDLARRSEYFSDSRVSRPSSIPKWLGRAIYFRDQGRCQCCGKDVSGLLHLDNKIHYDHVLPLARGGTNDPTNFQLLCDACNLTKSARVIEPQNRIAPYW